jgi:hypothetical protein
MKPVLSDVNADRSDGHGLAPLAAPSQLSWLAEGADHPIKYGGIDVSEAKRLRLREDENRKLKKLLAESVLDNAALKELLAKKW